MSKQRHSGIRGVLGMAPVRMAAVFGVVFALSLVLQAQPTLPDPDSFYHVRIAELMSRQGVVRDFVWLPHTVLADTFVDHHFLYHVLLVPFVTLLPPIVGGKLLAAILAGTSAVVLYALLASFGTRGAWWFAVAPALTPTYLFRINLVKAPVVSVILLALILYAVFKRKYAMLALLSFAYAWTYGGWPMLVPLVAVAVAAMGARRYLHELPAGKRDAWRLQAWRPWWQRDLIRMDWRLLGRSLARPDLLRLVATACAGVVAGVLINPYFPTNLSFAWVQFVKIGLVNYQTILNVGNEWYPYDFISLVADSLLVFAALPVACALFLLRWRQQSERSWAMAALMALFLLATIKSRRNMEYFVPFASLFAGFAITDALAGWSFRAWLADQKRLVALGLIAYLALIGLAVAGKSSLRTYQSFERGRHVATYADSMRWLREHAPAGAGVFHTSWDEFPLLFYHDPGKRYVSGLDPTFLYEASPDLHRQWRAVTGGRVTADLAGIMAENFDAAYVLADADHEEFLAALDQSPGISLRYFGPDALVYEIVGHGKTE